MEHDHQDDTVETEQQPTLIVSMGEDPSDLLPANPPAQPAIASVGQKRSAEEAFGEEEATESQPPAKDTPEERRERRKLLVWLQRYLSRYPEKLSNLDLGTDMMQMSNPELREAIEMCKVMVGEDSNFEMVKNYTNVGLQVYEVVATQVIAVNPFLLMPLQVYSPASARHS